MLVVMNAQQIGMIILSTTKTKTKTKKVSLNDG